MPQFPGGEQFGNRLPTLRSGGASADVGDAAAGLSRLASVGMQVAGKVAQNQRNIELGKLSTQAAGELQEFLFELKTDRDFESQYERFEQFNTDLEERYTEQIKGGERSKALLSQQLGELALKHAPTVRAQALNGQIDMQRGELARTLQGLSQLAVADDAEQQAQMTARAEQMLAQAYENGVIGAEDQATLAHEFENNIATGQARIDILRDPDVALMKLSTNDYGLSLPQQAQFLEAATAASESALRKRIAEAEAVERAQAKQQAEREAEVQKNGDRMLAAGNLSADWLEVNRTNLSPEDYRYFYRALSQNDAPGDPLVYADLRFAASKGDDIREHARTALQQGRISLPQYDKLIGAAETNAVDLPNWYEVYSNNLRTAFRVSEMNQDPAAPQRLANVLEGWETWARNNPGASWADAKAQAHQLRDAYQILDTDNTILTKPLPRNAVGGRNNLDIDQSLMALQAEFEAGRISEPDYLQQIELLQQWDQLIQEREAKRAQREQQRNEGL